MEWLPLSGIKHQLKLDAIAPWRVRRYRRMHCVTGVWIHGTPTRMAEVCAARAGLDTSIADTIAQYGAWLQPSTGKNRAGDLSMRKRLLENMPRPFTAQKVPIVVWRESF